jgi:hypothetical protein
MRTFSKLTQSTFVWTLSTIEIFSVEQRARIQKSILGLTSDTKTHGYLETIADMSSTEKPISISFSALGLQFFSTLEQRMRESCDTAVLMSDSRNLICLRNQSTTLGLSGDMRWSIYLDARRVWSEERPRDWMR